MKGKPEAVKMCMLQISRVKMVSNEEVLYKAESILHVEDVIAKTL